MATVRCYGQLDNGMTTTGMTTTYVLRRNARWFVLVLVIGLLPLTPAIGAAQSRGTTPHFEPPVARDMAPEDDLVRVRLTAQETRVHLRNGRATEMWALNGSVPAPTIEANVGDHVVVEFCNDLPAEAGEATLHWHGLEVAATQDGSNIAQHPVARGERVLPALRATDRDQRALFAVPFVSVLAGAMLAAETVKELAHWSPLSASVPRAVFLFLKPLAKSNGASSYGRQRDCPQCGNTTPGGAVRRNTSSQPPAGLDVARPLPSPVNLT